MKNLLLTGVLVFSVFIVLGSFVYGASHLFAEITTDFSVCKTPLKDTAAFHFPCLGK